MALPNNAALFKFDGIGTSNERTYRFYASLLFVRSGIILIAIILTDMSIRKSQYALTMIFRSLKVNSNQMTAFGVVTSGGRQDESIPGISSQILSNYKWVVRIALLLVVCYLWDELVVQNHPHRIESSSEWNELVMACLSGWSCFTLPMKDDYVSTFDDFVRVSFSWVLEPVCADVLQINNSHIFDDTKGSSSIDISCFKRPPLIFSRVLAAMGITFATFGLVVIAFEFVVSLLLKHKRRLIGFTLLIDLLIVASLLYWVYDIINGCIAHETLTSVSSWVSQLTFLAIPIILYNARRTASKIRHIIAHSNEQKAKRFQQAEIAEEIDAVLLGTSDRHYTRSHDSVMIDPSSDSLTETANTRRLKIRARNIQSRLLGRLRKAYVTTRVRPEERISEEEPSEDPSPPTH